MSGLIQFSRMVDNLGRVYPLIPHKAAIIVVNFIKERFRDEAWLDSTKESWKPRKTTQSKRDRSRRILTDSGKLRRSARKDRVTATSAIVAIGGNGIDYAQIHNEGGEINTTANVRAHTRKRQGRTEVVRKHTRKVYLIIDKRQFIGNSLTLDKRIVLQTTADIRRALKT